MSSGQKDRARVLEEWLADDEVQVSRYGRGEIWVNDGRAMAYALLGRPDEAVATLQRQAKLGFLSHTWRIALEDEPAFDSLRARKDFQALVADVRANQAREREKFLQMRAEGQIPKRADLRSGRSRPRLAHGVGRKDLVRHRIPEHVEPLPAAEAVAPALGMLALRVRAEEEVVRPFLVARARRRARDVRLAAVGEFRLVAQSAPGAFDPEHAL
jgi:hypothetical protein